MKNTNAKGTSYVRKVEKIAEQNAQRVMEQTAKITKNAETDSIINTYAREVMREYYKSGASKECGVKLSQLAETIAHSKINNIIEGQRRTVDGLLKFSEGGDVVQLLGLKADINRHSIIKIQDAQKELEELYYGEFNKDGDYVIECTDKKHADNILNKAVYALGLSGEDIVQGVKLYLWTQICKADIAKADENHLLNIFENYITSSKVYKNGNPKPVELWRKEATNGILEAFSVVRESIERERAPREQEVLYTSLFTSVTDPYTGETEEICVYKKANGITAEPSCDFNGKLFAITANDETEKAVAELPRRAKLTKRETYIYYKHYVGYWDNNKKCICFDTLQEIADHFKVTIESIKKSNTAIKNKIQPLYADIIIGYVPEGTEAKSVSAYNAETGEKMFVFASIGEAAKILNIDKGNISKVLKGTRKQTNGYIFK